MIHRITAHTVDRLLRDVMQDQRPFGGITVVLMGDFKQLLPVVRYGCGHQLQCECLSDIYIHRQDAICSASDADTIGTPPLTRC